MNKAVAKQVSVERRSPLVTPSQRAAVLRRTRGTWKGSAKKSLRTLVALRRGWNRKIK